MAWTPETFLVRYPEFRTGGALIPAALADAALMVDRGIYGAKYDYAVGLHAAQMLARSPFGISLRLVDKENKTPWDIQIDELKLKVSPRMIVT